MRPAAAAATLAAAALLAGCSSAPATPDRAALSATTLRQDVYALTALAHRGQWVNARAWVAQLQQDAMYARSSGALTVAQENRISALLDAVSADLQARIAAGTRDSSSTAPTRPRVARVEASSRARPSPSRLLPPVSEPSTSAPAPVRVASSRHPVKTRKPKPAHHRRHHRKHRHKPPHHRRRAASSAA